MFMGGSLFECDWLFALHPKTQGENTVVEYKQPMEELVRTRKSTKSGKKTLQSLFVRSLKIVKRTLNILYSGFLLNRQ